MHARTHEHKMRQETLENLLSLAKARKKTSPSKEREKERDGSKKQSGQKAIAAAAAVVAAAVAAVVAAAAVRAHPRDSQKSFPSYRPAGGKNERVCQIANFM